MARSSGGSRKDPSGKESVIDPVELRLDTKNPRFAGWGTGKLKEKQVIENLLLNADLRELIESIASNGYVTFEPLVVIDEGGEGELTVIEGNRRVAAIKLLRDPRLAADLKVNLPPIRPELMPTLKKAKILTVRSRDEARQYIGFKHINGPHKWDAFAKAKFAADRYRAESDSGLTISDIAHRLGDRHDTITRLVNGIFVLEQAQDAKVFDLNDRPSGRPFFFSHLYTALARPQYREYLGLTSEWRKTEPQEDPVPRKNLPKLKQILNWIYGSESEDEEPLVTSQNPHIKQLGEVLVNPLALKRLETTRSLADAYSEVDLRGKKFGESLIKSVRNAEDAQQLSDAYDGDETFLEFGRRLRKIARVLVRTMEEAREGNENDELADDEEGGE